MNNITYAVSVDVNNPIIPYNVYVASVLDSNVRYLEITLYQNGNVIVLSNEATATASLVTDDVLIDGSVECTISNNIITVPLEDLQRHGNLDVQVTVAEGTKVLAIPFPIQVRVTPNIAENAQIDENSLGSYAEVVHEIAEARGTHTTLHDAIAAKAPLSTAYTFDSTTTEVPFGVNNPKIIYLNAVVDGESGIVITSARNASNASFQIFFGRNGTTKIRYFTGGTSYSDWFQVTELVNNKKNSITASNRTSTDYYPSIKAVVDYLTANYLGSGDNTVSWANLAAAVQTLINGKESTSNKLSSGTGIDEDSTDTEYPSAKAVFNFGVDILDDVAGDLVLKENLSNKKNAIAGNETSEQYYPSIKAVVDYIAANYEALSNKLTSEEGIGSGSTDTEYPSAKAVYDLGVEILALVNDDISNVESRLVLKESASNKQSSITAVNKASTALYPSIKAVYDYGSQISSAVEDVKAYIGYTSGDILGLQADFENKRFTRLGAAVGKTAGSDFDTDVFPMYKNRRKCNVADDGTINAFYGDAGYTEDGSNGQVMVYQPKFYYKTVPLKLERADTGLGCNIRKANYYITATPRPGFRLHPVFHDSNGNEVEYVLFSAYEGSAYAPSLERIIDENTDTLSYSEGMKLCSVANVKPISGKLTGFGTRYNLEVMANARGAGWHIDTVQAIAANQLLMLIETGRFELQSVIGKGVVSLNSSAITGAAASFGNGTGEASVTYAVIGGTAYSEGGKRSVCYRGLENPWGSLCEHVNGINVWGNGSMYGGQVYIAGDFDFSDNRHTGNYHAAGFLLPNNIQANLGFNKYISSFGYSSEDFDWLFIPTEGNGNSAAPVGDTFYGSQDLNDNRTVCYGGRNYEGLGCGCAHWSFGQYVGTRNEGFGGRLFYVPTATA